PNVAVFDLAIQSPFRLLRAATHGRGFYELPAMFRVNALSAASRKTHGMAGDFDIQMPVSGTTAVTAGIECRTGGTNGDHQIVISFGAPVSFSGATVASGTGSVSSTSGSGTNSVTVNLTGVVNAQNVIVTVNNVNDGTVTAPVSVEMGVVAGDTTGNGVVNSADVTQTQSQSGQTVTAANFREDVTASGQINSADVTFVRSKSGTGLP